MTDVRLTATNPEDSSVVPVACNSKGELLVTEPKIELIDNDVSIEGDLSVLAPDDQRGIDNSFYAVTGPNQALVGQVYSPGYNQARLTAGGYLTSSTVWASHNTSGTGGASEIILSANAGSITFHCEDAKATGSSPAVTQRFAVTSSGPSSYDFTLVRTGDSRSWKSEVSVFDELLFLRDQVRSLMEKLKMTPEGGWEVWDGSAETTES